VGRNLLQQLQPFCSEAVFKLGKAGDVAAGPGQALDEARADRVDALREHDRDGAGRLHHRYQGEVAGREDDVGRERDQFRRVFATAVGIICTPAIVDPQVTTIGPTQRLERLLERRAAGH
jgi:hypothetical protein